MLALHPGNGVRCTCRRGERCSVPGARGAVPHEECHLLAPRPGLAPSAQREESSVGAAGPCGGGSQLGRLPWLLRGRPHGTGTSYTRRAQEEPRRPRVPRWAHPYPHGWFKWDAAGGSGATLLSHPLSWSPCAWPGDRCRFKTSHHASASVCPRGSGVTLLGRGCCGWKEPGHKVLEQLFRVP